MHRLNPDALTCLLLRKLNDSIDDRFIKCRLNFDHLHQYHIITRSLAAEFSLDQSQISRILKEVIDYIYEHDQYLIRCRNLDIDRYLLFTFTIITFLDLLRNLREMMDEAHHATLLNSRAAATFAPLLQHPAQKLVV